LAIGKSGLNVRLASQLVGWSIDVVKKGEMDTNLLEKLMAEKNNNQKVEEAKEVKEEVVQEEHEAVKKIKVNEAAVSLGMDVNDFMAKLEELGHKVKSSNSNIDEEIFEQVKESL
jgi:DNA-binding NtrC family response regulator